MLSMLSRIFLSRLITRVAGPSLLQAAANPTQVFFSFFLFGKKKKKVYLCLNWLFILFKYRGYLGRLANFCVWKGKQRGQRRMHFRNDFFFFNFQRVAGV